HPPTPAFLHRICTFRKRRRSALNGLRRAHPFRARLDPQPRRASAPPLPRSPIPCQGVRRIAHDPGRDLIPIRGARENNLKGFDLDLPARRLIVIAGLSGSGKSSLAFDTLYAEGQRRYIETFSPYARQFFDRMDKPRVDAIEGIPPAIALEQRNSVRTTRSTVGTMTEICDHMKVLWPRLARLHCLNCGEPVRKEAPGEIWDALRPGAHAGSATEPARNPPARADALITFTLPLSGKL